MSAGHSSHSAEADRQRRREQVASFRDVRQLNSQKAELRFDADHRYTQAGRSEFKSEAELVKYVAELLPCVPYGTGLKGSFKRVGKYRRITEDGDYAFSFGDPLLDYITDDDGALVLNNRRLNLYASEIARSDRGGGLTSLDFTGNIEHLRRAHLKASVMPNSPFSLIECDRDNLIVASRNPREMYFYNGTTKMRFRAFDRSYFIYEKIGADIETWGRDFRSATIRSDYGRFLDETHGHCFRLYSDSDSDSNDDYVDEYEWFLGGGVSSGYDGVTSSCVANWHDRIYSGVVSYGCIVIDI